MSLLDPLLDALRNSAEPAGPVAALATVTGVASNGVLVQFDGESVASTRRYMRMGTDAITSGSRVMMIKAGTTWVVTGTVRAGPGIQGGNAVVGVDASGYGTITYPVPYLYTPIVMMIGATAGLQCELQDPGPGTSAFSFRTFTPAGALQVSTNVRVLWVAFPVT